MDNNYEQTMQFQRNNDNASVIIVGKSSDPILTVPITGTLNLGRKVPGSNCDIALSSPLVSRAHGVFMRVANNYYYTDSHSTNGTYLNGEKLKITSERGSDPVMLNDGDILRIDRRTLDNPHPDAVTMIFSTSYDDSSRWTKYTLRDNHEVVIGRNSQSGIDLKKNYISAKHAVISVRNGHIYITNCGSKNGVYVNNKFIKNETELFERNVIRICDILIFVLDGMLIYNTAALAGGGLLINIKETAVREHGRKKVLIQDINIEVNSGDFVLILGGSGAGKSTLFNSILGKYKIKGKIQMKKDASQSQESGIGYVPQKLQLRADERLIDAVTDTAILRLRKQMSSAERKQFILNTLETLGLRDKCKKPIKKLSGGEQRRAAIAAEAVTDPDIFFLDEPDSGLDPKSGMELMNNLKTFSNRGKIVMLITHNYASYPHPEEIYTKVLVLAKSNRENVGKLAFLGSVVQALEFFGVENLRDITRVIDPVSENGEGRADEFVDKFRRMTK